MEFYQQPQLQDCCRMLEKEIKRVCDLPVVCKRICGMKEKAVDWIHLIDSMNAVIEIGRLNETMMKYSDKFVAISIVIT